MKYNVEKQSQHIDVESYCGYIDGVYAGKVTGVKLSSKIFNIQSSSLETQFRGTKCVRALKEIIDAVMKDYDFVRSRIDNKDNDEIKMILSAGFHIIGTVTYKDEIAIELLKVKEEVNG